MVINNNRYRNKTSVEQHRQKARTHAWTKEQKAK
jgi:hypothetical protein